jgi:hypothetical protein
VDEFSRETRDATWAPATEAELKARWKKIRGGTLESVECRQSQCKVAVSGSTDEVSTTIAELEGSHGLHGYAQNVLLSGPETKADGSITLRIVIRFER